MGRRARWLLCALLLPLSACSGEKKAAVEKQPEQVLRQQSPFNVARTQVPACDALVDEAEMLLWPHAGPQLRASMAAAAPSFGRESGPRVVEALTAHGVRWAQRSAQLCVRHSTQGAVSALEQKQRSACLSEAFARLRSLVSALEQGDAGVVEWASHAVDQLDARLVTCELPAVFQGYDIDAIGDARAVQALADVEVFAMLRRGEDSQRAMHRLKGELPRSESQLLRARAMVLDARGRDEAAAEDLLERALLHYKEAASADGRMRALLLAAQVYADYEHYGDARAQLELALQSCDGLYGKASVQCAAARRAMAQVAARGGQPGRARELLEEGLAGLVAVGAVARSEALMLRVALLSVALRAGDLPRARAQGQKLAALGPKLLGPEHPQVGDHWLLRGRLATRMGQHRMAVKAFERALRIHRAAHGESHRRVADDLASLGRALRAQGQAKRASVIFERALRVRKGLDGGRAGRALGRALFEAAQAQIEAGRPPKRCLERLQQARQIYEKQLGVDHAEVGEVVDLMGRYFSAKGNHRKAYMQHLEAVKILSAALGSDHQKTRAAMERLDRAVDAQGR
ncbi:MAG: tetratricopeptide repeat protein [Myxococcales bacterium]|nr:tetratricopeptide repeat protein [Myxococcales bacterium]